MRRITPLITSLFVVTLFGSWDDATAVRTRSAAAEEGSPGAAANSGREGTHEAISDEEDLTERATLLIRALEVVRERVEPNTWRKAWNVVVEQDSPSHVADELGVSVSTVYKAKARVLSHIETELNELLQ